MVCYGPWDTLVGMKHNHGCFYQKSVGKDHQCIMRISITSVYLILSVSNPFPLVYLWTAGHFTPLRMRVGKAHAIFITYTCPLGLYDDNELN